MSKAILISIHPKYVLKILSGEKIFEYRKVIPKQKVSFLIIYCTAPVKKIVAVAEVINCITASPSKIWNTTSIGAGISHKFFREYYIGHKIACAFTLGNVYEMKEPLPLTFLDGIKSPPQSYCYLGTPNLKKILRRRVVSVDGHSRMAFVGGIHGAGKGTICTKIFRPAGYQCMTASSLIAEQGKRTGHTKKVSSVPDNQSVLLQALKEVKTKNNRLLLDGHFTLITEKNTIEPIDIEVFRTMKISQLFLVKGEVDEISARLKNRDNRKWGTSFLDDFQKKEEAHARYVAKDIGVPLRILRS